ncbi:glycosyltransferase family 2 protein [Porphyromonas macacae]|uniref:PGL/p-HBAD biosynthesis glycosyltransferase Rv2957/MT3031 n=1 Tax=Porphyromonas macacae TaxID=28115 RepID=A0A379DFY2_9PORP|nr:glycosyltransferase family 2 protein [Porphyromonas macacae]SUB77241.1 PGL/p-HBAD biosynthesis glycosyltransferase Rv2957/MT3031 [Porphyromonas macacae]
MHSKKILSIITVCYRAENLIEATLKSVESVKTTDVEYIIVDGGSTDGTMRLVKQYAHIVDTLRSEPDNGIYDAMNKARTLATGEWIIFMNAGDIFASAHVLDVFKPLLEKESDVDVIYGDILKEGKNGELYCKKAYPPGNYHKMFFCHQAAFTRRILLEKYPFDTSCKLSADFKFYKQVTLAGYRFLYHSHPVAVFDTHGASNIHRTKGLAENIKIISDLDCFSEKMRLLPRIYVSYFFARLRGK